MTSLPRDNDNTPIPALGLRPDGAHTIDATDTAARNTTAFNSSTVVASVFATVPCFIAFGDETVVATTDSHYYPANLYYDFAVGGNVLPSQPGGHDQFTHISVLRAGTTDGKVYISEKQ